ncbi:TolC family protein [Pelagicoccus enzymogenes]|uniref:TolC family protein n=1 Tax=Pelagicoccus enzymogenes TaxID=2773457 RepID=UPI00280C4260|nr:TolC family protein [Pelagicoccus enzymogenes]MDQ8201030.1 TolC family protein [Pelagicoccus enzymogenes]
MEKDSPSKVSRSIVAGVTLAASLAWTGCTTQSYRKRADKAAYQVVSQVEEQIFGTPSDFSIETEYSNRNPKQIRIEEIFADRSVEGQLNLSLSDALAIATRSSRQYQNEKERLYLTALSLTGQRHAFRPQFFARSSARRNVSADGEETDSIGTDVGVGLLLATGADLSLNIANDILRFVSNPSSESLSSALSFSISQPLLRGAGKKVAAERLTQAQRDVIYSVRNFAHFENEFAVSVVMDYFRLLQRKDTVYNEYKNYQSRIKSTEYLKARSVDRAKALDVNRAEQSELSARNRYINSIVAYRNSLDRFKITLGLPQTVEIRLQDSEMESLKEKGLIFHKLDAQLGYQLATEHRLPLLNEIDQFEDVKRRTLIAADQLKPGLGFSASATVDSLDDNRYDEFDFDRVRRDVGLTLDLPLNKLSQRNNYRSALIGFESEIRSFSLTLDQLRSQIEESFQNLERLRQNYEIQSNAVVLAEKSVLGAQLSIEAGEGIYRDLEDAQDNLISAQNAQTGAIVDYLEARLGLLIFIGIIDTDTDRFWLTEASKVDLSALDSEASLSKTVQSDGSVITPDQLFNL